MTGDAGFRPSGPAVLHPHDPRWGLWADEQLGSLRRTLRPVVQDLAVCSFEHIGSTAVPGLASKAVVDLQVCLTSFPEPEVLDPVLAPLGWVPARGSRPDSPGVTRDSPAPGDDEPDEVWRKRLFTRSGSVQPAILHVRLTASPFGRRTLVFRDRLRAEPNLRSAYEQLKRGLAAEHAGAADYDDYTRGKTGFIRSASVR